VPDWQRFMVALAFLASLPGTSSAQSPPGAAPLTLSEAMALAEANDAGLSADLLRARAAEEKSNAARLSRLPVLSLSSDWDRTSVPARVFAQKLNRGDFQANDFAIESLNSPGSDASLETVLGVRWQLDAFGVVAASAGEARAAAEEGSARAEGRRGDLRLAVTRVFFGILSADRLALASEKSVEAARELETATEARERAGAELTADLLRARSRRRQRETDLEHVRSAAELLRSRFRVLLGWASDRELVLDPPAGDTSQRDLEEWLRRGFSTSPEIRAAEASVLGARESVRREQRSVFPSLFLSAGYQDNRLNFVGGHQSGSIDLRFSWDLFDPARRARAASERALFSAAESSRRAQLDAVRLRIEEAWRAERLARLDASTAEIGRREAEEAFRVIHERWLAGKALLSDALETEGALAAARAAEAAAQSAVAISEAALKRTAGEL
jgi:outer membrane protein TolC